MGKLSVNQPQSNGASKKHQGQEKDPKKAETQAQPGKEKEAQEANVRVCCCSNKLRRTLPVTVMEFSPSTNPKHAVRKFGARLESASL